MSILQSFNRLGRFIRGGRFWRRDDAHCVSKKLRICKFENLEVRNPLTANPFPDIHLGSVYLEPATGDDSSPNTIQLTFQGGAPGTQLTQIIINGDKDGNGKYSSGEIFFDTAPGGQGVFKSQPFQVVQANGFTVTSFQVADGGQQLIINLNNFVAGDKLIFSIDVDEVNFVPSDGSPPDINSIVEGDEFQRSIMTASFVAPHYQNITGQTLYWDAFDQKFTDANASSGTTLDLPPDSYQPPSTKDVTDFTAGAVLQLTQVPLPSSLSGTVYYDKNLSNLLDPGETGISGVTLTLFQWNGSQYISTGVTTQTDANGNYSFNNLLPGQYCVAETQPSGYFSVGSQTGTVDGSVDGMSMDADHLCNIVLLGGQDGIHYNFGEALPGSISGTVHADPEGDCIIGPNDILLSGVQIDLLDSQGHVIATTTTNAQGFYEFDGLAPGQGYGVFEHQPAGYFQGDAMPGSVGGVESAVDTITQVLIGSDVHGINYDFCELMPASIAGRVWADPQADCVFGPNDLPLSGVTIELRDSQGHIIATTTTDQQGNYEFDDLAPGEYQVFEHQPAGYLQGMANVGTEGGENSATDLISSIVLGSNAHGLHYDFCEELPNSISGYVHADPEGDCIIGPNDIMLAGVQIDLLDSQGHVIATTTTNAQGFYEFDNLEGGTYGVFEHQPAGYFSDGGDVGSLGGVVNGDLITQIVLMSDDHGVHYDFCEHMPNSISGYVHADPEGDCIIGPNDIMLAGVQIDLRDSTGHVIATTTTNDQGYYEFTGLDGGTYSVFEHQPAGYFSDGGDVGSLGGVVDGDLISQIVLVSDDHGVHYDFCEHIPNSIQGSVHLDPEGDCEIGPNDIMLSGVTVDLLNQQGQVIASTTTNAQGIYTFDGLDGGNYSVRVHPLPQYFDDGGDVGSLGGEANGDIISQIVLVSDDHGVDYNFCFHPPASISGYVFQDGPPVVLPPGQTTIPDVETIRDGKRTPDDKPIAGVTLLLYDNQGNAILDSSGNQLKAVTDSNGFYEFTGLDAGTYLVREFQPAGYIDSIDTPGSTGGLADNHHSPQGPFASLPFNPNYDVITTITLGVGQSSVENDFSEVAVTRTPFFIPPPTNPPTNPPPLANPAPSPLSPLIIPPYQPLPNYPDLNGGAALGYTWHLSVVDAGYPRGLQDQQVSMVLSNISVEMASWMDMNSVLAELTFIDSSGNKITREVNGFKDAIPVVGDFRGDGNSELGFYVDGQWFIDLNGDGKWDTGDIWARLGTRDDQPVVGDWNGDGKMDIGIYGPAWPRDPHAVAVDRGLPSPLNKMEVVSKRKKNIPPDAEDATSGNRQLQRGETAKVRADFIDHVFHYGTAVEKAIVGDWMGTGLRHVGVFRNGKWYLDIDGDGRLTDKDLECVFGQEGDIPVVGDWTGDGIEKIGVYRHGTFYLDTNNNHKLDEGDRVIQLGQDGDIPVVGNFDGSAKAEVGVYHPTGATAVKTAEAPHANLK